MARVTLTDKRIIISRRRHKSISYDDVEVVSGGWWATNVRWLSLENTQMIYGLYVQTADYADSAFVGRAKEAAAMIKARSSGATLL